MRTYDPTPNLCPIYGPTEFYYEAHRCRTRIERTVLRKKYAVIHEDGRVEIRYPALFEFKYNHVRDRPKMSTKERKKLRKAWKQIAKKQRVQLGMSISLPLQIKSQLEVPATESTSEQ